jgi:2,3,4,5-tetrahydropyridine-2-carboxylate N-succinyltransferase
MSQQLQNIIDAAWEDRANISVNSSSQEVRDAVEHVIHELDSGRLRVATREAWANGPPTSGSKKQCC